MTQLAVFVLLLATWMLPGGAIAQSPCRNRITSSSSSRKTMPSIRSSILRQRPT